MHAARPLFIPVILGTVRKGRMSESAARVMMHELEKRTAVETALIDIAEIRISPDDEGQNANDAKFSALIKRADALVIVAPEYNHGYPGMLKHVLDSCLEEYIHKAVGVVGVSTGIFGGTRVIENFLPVLREYGLVTIFWDVNFANAHRIFSKEHELLEKSYLPRIDQFLKELIWMAETLRYGREHISLE